MVKPIRAQIDCHVWKVSSLLTGYMSEHVGRTVEGES